MFRVSTRWHCGAKHKTEIRHVTRNKIASIQSTLTIVRNESTNEIVVNVSAVRYVKNLIAKIRTCPLLSADWTSQAELIRHVTNIGDKSAADHVMESESQPIRRSFLKTKNIEHVMIKIIVEETTIRKMYRRSFTSSESSWDTEIIFSFLLGAF